MVISNSQFSSQLITFASVALSSQIFDFHQSLRCGLALTYNLDLRYAAFNEHGLKCKLLVKPKVHPLMEYLSMALKLYYETNFSLDFTSHLAFHLILHNLCKCILKPRIVYKNYFKTNHETKKDKHNAVAIPQRLH